MSEKGSILFVDDNENMCKSMSMIFERMDYDTHTAFDGADAVEAVRERSFDLIFMDIKMPKLNGVEALHEIKLVRPDVIVVMMTAYTKDALVSEAFKEGAYDVLNKPFDLKQIIALVERLMNASERALILIVDDDESARITLKKILERRLFRVSEASSGEEAFDMVREMRYDIILLDTRLPGMNGYETYLALKVIEPKISVILITAFEREMATEIEEALRNNAYTTLTKPLDIQRLFNHIDELLKQKY